MGVDQFNIRVPENAVEGCDVGFRLHYPGPLGSNTRHTEVVSVPQSQTVPLSIREGGGRCEPRPYDSLAELTWQRMLRSTIAGVTREDRLVVRIVRNNKLPLTFRRRPVTADTPTIFKQDQAEDIPANPRCPQFFDEKLDAGRLILTGPGFGEIVVAPDFTSGQPVYDAPLPPESLTAGRYTVRAEGGADVGAFETTIDLDEPIEITSQFEPGIFIPQPFEVNWNGGEVGAIVRLVRASGLHSWNARTPASSGSAFFATALSEPGVFGRVIVVHQPEDETFQQFEADGLTMGGRHTWRYEFQYHYGEGF